MNKNKEVYDKIKEELEKINHMLVTVDENVYIHPKSEIKFYSVAYHVDKGFYVRKEDESNSLDIKFMWNKEYFQNKEYEQANEAVEKITDIVEEEKALRAASELLSGM